MIELKSISKQYAADGAFAVRDVSLAVQSGETLVLLGSSGCGKTTVLKMINRLIEPTAGEALIDGVSNTATPAAKLRRSIGYVFQDIGLFPHMTVGQNIGITPRLLGWPRARRERRTAELLELLGLDAALHAERYPRELSGGQQQRVGIARALAADPAHLLMDEPFGALDAVTRDQLQREMLRLKETLHKTIVFVTHDLFEAIRLADRIAVMNAGAIEQVGTAPELMAEPATEFVEALFEQARAQAALVEGGDA